MFYGRAAILQWGITESVEAIDRVISVTSLYYNNMNTEGGHPPGIDDSKDRYPSLPEENETPRSVRGKQRANQKRGEPARMVEVMDLVMLLSVQSRPTQNRERSFTREDVVQDKVTSWLQGQ